MRSRHKLAATLLSLVAAITPAAATDLGTWLEDDLAPWLATQLTEHPRFKGETVVFVALDNGTPAPVTNELNLALKQRLTTLIGDTPGIRIGWQPGHEAAARSNAPVDCTRDAVHYYIGIDTQKLIGGNYRVMLRMLDGEDMSWISGTSKRWEGRLNSKQERAYKKEITDDYFRGSREAPYTTQQQDLLAAQLAHDLGCELLGQVAGEYVIHAISGAAADPTLPGALALVRNNLAGQPALKLTANADAANARLDGQAHAIAGELYQYWVTVTPTGSDDNLPALSASAYVRLPIAPVSRIAQTAPRSVKMPVTPATPARTTPPVGAASAATPASSPTSPTTLLDPLLIVEPNRRRACNYRGSYHRAGLITADHTIERGDCFLLQTRAHRDAQVFLLNFQVIHGLVNLSGRRCGHNAAWIDARAGKPLHFPTVNDARQSASAWQGHEGLESFYAIAVSDTNAARALSGHIDQLPTRCGLSATHGLKGQALDTWLAELGEITNRWRYAVDWQAVRVQHVY
jgi:hypothetical protein